MISKRYSTFSSGRGTRCRLLTRTPHGSASAALGLMACLVSGCSSKTTPAQESATATGTGTTTATATATATATEDASTTTTGTSTTDGSTSAASSSSSSTATPSELVAACPSDGGTSVLSFTNQTYLNDPRAPPTEAIFSGVNSVDDPYTQLLRVHNSGTGPVTITSVGIAPQATLFPVAFRQTSNPSAFTATVVATSDAGTTSLTLPQTIAAGGDLDIEVQFLSTKTNPPTRFDNTGDDAVAALLVAQSSGDCAQAGLYGIGLWNDSESISDAGVPTSNYGRFEPTLGQIIATLGYQVNVGTLLQTFLNVNQVSAFAMDPPPSGDTPSDEVIAQTFVLADTTKPAVLLAPARFAPKYDFPYGWYAAGSINAVAAQPNAADAEPPPAGVPGNLPAGLQWVATMESVVGSDNYTSDHSEMVLPPITGTNPAGTFMPTPVTASFGLWCFGNQRTGGSAPLNGDYDYSQDNLNIVTQVANPPLPADLAEAGVNHFLTTPVHRYRVWPLKDRGGNPVANSYLIALEEATNDDFQDMIFTLSNVKPAPPVSDGGADAQAVVDGGTEQ